MTDTDYMKQALMEAQKAGERGEVPVGAVVVCKDRIIARAHNLTETLTDVTAHAEMQAITAAAATLGGNNVQFQTVFPPVPVAYHISVMFQISRNRIFSGFSQSIMYCHSTIFFLSVQKYVFSALFLQK